MAYKLTLGLVKRGKESKKATRIFPICNVNDDLIIVVITVVSV